MAILQSFQNLDPAKIISSIAASIGLYEILLFLVVGMNFAIFQIAGMYNFWKFKVRRKRVNYLDKIDDRGNYQGAWK